MKEDFEYLSPILIVDNLLIDNQITNKKDKVNDKEISQSEEILLTLIAEIVVEIILKEDL